MIVVCRNAKKRFNKPHKTDHYISNYLIILYFNSKINIIYESFGGESLDTGKKKRFLINFAYVLVSGMLIFLTFTFLINYLAPFIIAVIIAFLMQKPAAFLSKKIKLKKGITAAFFSAMVYLVFAFLVVFIIYKSTVFLANFAEQIPKIFEEISVIINKLQQKFSKMIPQEYNFALEDLWNNVLKKIAAVLGNYISETLTKIAKNTPSFLFSSIVALVASCYIAKDYDVLVKFTKSLCGKNVSENVIKVKNILFEIVFKFLKGYLILIFITFLELFIGFTVLRVKYAFLIAILISFVDILPVLGTGTVLVPWAIISVFLNKIGLAVGLVVLYVLVVLVRNFLEPKIIGAQIGINPLFTLLAMFVGLKLLGVTGLFLFPIILIVIIKFYKNQMQEGLSV